QTALTGRAVSPRQGGPGDRHVCGFSVGSARVSDVRARWAAIGAAVIASVSVAGAQPVDPSAPPPAPTEAPESPEPPEPPEPPEAPEATEAPEPPASPASPASGDAPAEAAAPTRS